MSRRRRWYENTLRSAVWLCTGATAALLAWLIGYLLVRGLRYVTWDLLTTQRSALQGTMGILPNLIFTVYLIITTLVLALPLGIGAAIYLTEYARQGRWVRTVEFATEILAGIPSILYGLVGMMVFVQGLGLGTGILAGALTLTVMNLPYIVRTTQEALRAVPDEYRQGAMGLGATRWYTLRTILLPASRDGIVGGTILAMGRMVGESAALLFTAGSGYTLVTNFWQALRTSGGSLSVALYLYVSEYGEFDVGFAIAAILMLLVLALNFGAKAAGKGGSGRRKRSSQRGT
jgi:phosphate transport system permease protein